MTRIILAALLAFSVSLRGAEVVVSAAASLKDALTEVAANYEKAAPDKIVFNFAGSNLLARQIADGAPADLFFSADEQQMDGLEEKGLIVAGTRTSLLSNTLVVIVPRAGTVAIGEPRDLARDDIRRLALADPGAVPAGVYARAFLEKSGLWKAVEPKVVPMQNVRAALAVVASGDAEAGIVYRTDAAISKAVKVAFAVPAADGPPISYSTALLADAQHAGAARKFLRHLESPDAARIFTKFGFIVRAP